MTILIVLRTIPLATPRQRIEGIQYHRELYCRPSSTNLIFSILCSEPVQLSYYPKSKSISCYSEMSWNVEHTALYNRRWVRTSISSWQNICMDLEQSCSLRFQVQLTACKPFKAPSKADTIAIAGTFDPHVCFDYNLLGTQMHAITAASQINLSADKAWAKGYLGACSFHIMRM